MKIKIKVEVHKDEDEYDWNKHGTAHFTMDVASTHLAGFGTFMDLLIGAAIADMERRKAGEVDES